MAGKTVLDMVKEARKTKGTSNLWIDLKEQSHFNLEMKPIPGLDELAGREDLMNPGHKACAGCGAALALRHAVRILGRRR